MIYHIAARADWDAAQEAGLYAADSLASEGFIHCSTGAQVLGTAGRFYAGRHDLVLLAIDPARLTAELRYEEGEPGVLFPHLYGPLGLHAVVGIYPFAPAEDGSFAMPTMMRDP
jgi:glutathione S-transferase